MTVKERLKEYQKVKGISDSKFEKLTGKSRGFWHSCTNPGVEYLQVVLQTFPELSAEWVFRGEGPMLRGEGGGQVVYSDVYYKQLIAMKQERVDQLENELASLKANIFSA